MKTSTLLGGAIALGLLLAASCYYVRVPWLAQAFPSLYESSSAPVVEMVQASNPRPPLIPLPIVSKSAVPCAQCGGRGYFACSSPGCEHGQVVCPDKCLKLNVGHWEHLQVEGHGPDELWQKFYYPGGWSAFSQDHCGHIIVVQEGKAIDAGPCPTCKGAAKENCAVCQGMGQIACPTCGGNGKIAAVGAPDAPH